ncbi:MAG: hypothetical protein ACPGU9_09200 [Flavobacteriaceae bacterium]
MGSPFKMNPKTPFMKALVGKQKNLPDHLKQAILDAPETPAKSYGKSPMKKDPTKKEGAGTAAPGRTYLDMKPGQYGKVRQLTNKEIIDQVKKTGKSSAQIKAEQKKYMDAASKAKQKAKDIPGTATNQMGEILAAGGARGEKGIAEEAKKRSAGTPAKSYGSKKKTPMMKKGVKGLKGSPAKMKGVKALKK